MAPLPITGLLVALAGAAATLAACQSEPPPPAQPTEAPAQPTAPVQTGVASYYAPDLAGERTASGEPHDPEAMTAASPSLPLGSTAKVTNIESGRSVTVEVNDRGPFTKSRILDVSRRAAERLGFKRDGVAKVAVRPMAEPGR